MQAKQAEEYQRDLIQFRLDLKAEQERLRQAEKQAEDIKAVRATMRGGAQR